MSKVLITADLHIKLGQAKVPVDWAKKRYDLFVDQLIQIYKRFGCGACFFAGDTLDRVPSMQELAVLFSMLSRLASADVFTYLLPGNHEAEKKKTTFLSHLREAIEEFRYIHLIDKPSILPILNVDVLPYNHLSDLTTISPINKILITHVRGDIPPHVKAEVDLALFDRWELVIAGDLHSRDNSQRNIVYPGSPMTTSFHRSKVDSYVIVLDTETLQVQYVPLSIPQMIRKTVSSLEEMVPTDDDLTIYELETDSASMAKIKASELPACFDKSINTKPTKSKLALTSEMTLLDEVSIYLDEVLRMPTESKTKILSRVSGLLKDIDAN